MGREQADVPDAELAVLDVLWNRGQCTIRQITEVLYPEGTTAKYATVQKLLERLETRGCVLRDRTESVHVFAATVDRNELVGRRVRKIAEKLCGGSMTRLLTQLMRHEPLSPDELREIRDAIAEIDQRPKRKRRK